MIQHKNLFSLFSGKSDTIYTTKNKQKQHGKKKTFKNIPIAFVEELNDLNRRVRFGHH